jgi:hypothetical protein
VAKNVPPEWKSAEPGGWALKELATGFYEDLHKIPGGKE